MVKPLRNTDLKLDGNAQCLKCGQRYRVKLEEPVETYEERNWNEKQQHDAKIW
jgi:hypothetical protein